MRKEEIARNEQFLLFPQFFLHNRKFVSPFVNIFDISLFAAELEETIIRMCGRGLSYFQHYYSHITETDHIFICFLDFTSTSLGLWKVFPTEAPAKKKKRNRIKSISNMGPPGYEVEHLATKPHRSHMKSSRIRWRTFLTHYQMTKF